MKLLPLLLLVGCGAGGAGLPSATDLSTYAAQQFVCVETADARPAADACRAASKTAFCARFPSTCDAGAP